MTTETFDVITMGRVSVAAGALVASRLACADDMPTLDELRALVGDEVRT